MYTFKQYHVLCSLAKASKDSLDNPYHAKYRFDTYAWWKRLIELCKLCELPEPTEAEAEAIEHGWQHYRQLCEMREARIGLEEFVKRVNQ